MYTLLVVLIPLSLSVGTSIAQVVFDPQFDIGEREVTEGGNLSVRLSAEALTNQLLLTSGFDTSGVIEVDVIPKKGPTEPFADFKSDYDICPNDSSTIITLLFVVRQTNSTEVQICILDDNTFEGSEYFQLTILAVRFPPNLRPFFILTPGFDSVFVSIKIEDNDIVNVKWVLDSVFVNESNISVALHVVSEGEFARPISIGVACSPVIASDVSAAEENSDWTVNQTALTISKMDRASSDPLIAYIVNDDDAEPTESFICNLQSGNADEVKAVPPTQVTVSILDDDELVISWEQDFYKFRESDLLANVTLVTTSNFNTSVKIPGIPTQIVNNITSVTVRGPILPNIGSLPATINFVTFREIQYGVARIAGITQFPDIVSSVNDFCFTPTPMGNRSTRGFDIKDDAILEYDELFMAKFDISSLIDEGWNAREGDIPITYIAIEDDDCVEVNFKESSYRVNESAGQVQVTLITGQFFIEFVNATVECMEGNATDPEDWEEARQYQVEFRLTRTSDRIAPLKVAESEPIILNITNDTIYEGDEVFTCRIVSTSDNATVKIGPRNEVPVTIVDDDKLVPVIIHNQTVFEGEKANITLELESSLVSECSITVQTMDASAIAPGDYMSDRYTVVIPAGDTKAFLIVMTNDDDIAELTETFTVTIVDTCDLAFPGNPSTGYVHIRDNDTITCSKASQRATVNEGNPAEITVNCSGQYDFDFTLSLDNTDGSAVAPGDYTPGEYLLPFSGDQTSALLTVDTVADSIAECDESFQTKITNSSRPEKIKIVNPDTCDVVIEDNNVLMVMFDPVDYEVSEGQTADVMLVTNLPYSFNFSVVVACVNGSAFAPGDFIAEEYTVNFPASLDGPGKASIPVRTLTDNVLEDVEFLKCNILEIRSDDACSILPGPDDMARVNITDNTNAIVCFEPLRYPVIEGESVTLTLVTNVIVQKSFSVVVTTVDGSASSSSDYVGGTMTANFVVDSSTASVTYETVDDLVREETEFFTAQLSVSPAMQAMGISVGENCTATVEITDNEDLIVMFEAKACITPECDSLDGNAMLEVALVATTTCDEEYTVIVTALDVTAKEGEDYIGQSFSVNFSSSETRVPFNITIACDNIAELDEIFTLQLEAPQNMDGKCRNVQLGTRVRKNCTIEDEDTITCSKAPENATVTEGGVAGLTVECSGQYEFNFTLSLDTMDGSAVAPGDYTSGGYSLSFTAGQTSSILSVSTSDDTIAELEEYFKVMITGSDRPRKVIISDPDTCFVTIEDNDVITCSKAPENATVTEGGVAELTVECSGQYEFDFTLFLDTMDGSAVAPGDYNSGGYSLSFSAGDASDTLSVPTSNDTIAELEEFFKVMITGSDRPDKVIIGDPDTCYVTIQDNDVITCSKAPENATVTEGGVARLTVVCSGQYEFDFTLFLDTMDGSAVAPGDYTSGEYSLSFTAGQTSDMLSVAINNDTIAECDEFFKVMITRSDLRDKVRIGDPNICFVNIEDDDDLEVCINVTSDSCLENVGICPVYVVANGPAECEYSVTVRTRDGTAVAPEDYINREYNVSFQPFETHKHIDLEIVDDNCVEDREEFSLEFGIGGDSRFRNVQFCDETDVPIVDNDVQVYFTEEIYSVLEVRTIPLSLTIEGDPSLQFSVEIIVKPGGTATESLDFTGVPRLVDIPRSAAEVFFDFSALCDGIDEGLEYVLLGIVIPDEYTSRVKAISPNMTRVNIMENRDCPGRETVPVNDSVIADPLFTVPLRTMNTSNIIEGTPLCYEVHGRPDRYFNLVSDDCTSVNAHYVAAVRPRAGNVIGQIGIVTSDNSNRCHQIQVDVTSDGQCQTQIDGVDISGTTYRNNITRVSVMAGRHYVRVSTPNCAEQDLVMWIRCHKPTLNQTGDSFEQPMIKFVVTRGLKTRSEAHGLIGQFWGVPVHVTPYTGGLLPSAQPHSGTYYTLFFNATNASQRRTFTAKLGWTTWRLNFIPTLPGYRCFYAGNSQGGPSIEATDPGVQDSVIEGKYKDYEANGLFETQWHDEFSRFKAVCS